MSSYPFAAYLASQEIAKQKKPTRISFFKAEAFFKPRLENRTGICLTSLNHLGIGADHKY